MKTLTTICIPDQIIIMKHIWALIEQRKNDEALRVVNNQIQKWEDLSK